MSRKGKKRFHKQLQRHCALCGELIQHPGKDSVVGSTGQPICYACLEIAEDIAQLEFPDQKSETETFHIRTPRDILDELDKSIIGQQDAKSAVAIAFWKQQLRASGASSAPRSTLLLYGPTGCGKTALVKEAARITGFPFIHFDATTLSEAGYRGRDAVDMVKDLVSKFKDHEKVSYGIIFVDEIDKLAAQGGEQRIAYAKGTQHSLLRLIEGAEVHTNGRDINTENLLFVFGGAFSGLSRKQAQMHRIGFEVQLQNESQTAEIQTEDFIAYGMEPELMGRINQCVSLCQLTRDDLKLILLKAENSILKQYQTFFKEQGVLLQISADTIEQLVDEALRTGSGARGLQTAVEKMLQPHLLRLAEHKKDRLEVWEVGLEL